MPRISTKPGAVNCPGKLGLNLPCRSVPLDSCLALAAAFLLTASCLKVEGSEPVSATPVLTAEEQAWLQVHGPIRYAPDPAFAPFEFFKPDGRAAGITPDLLHLIADRLGTEIRPVRFTNWSEVLAGMKRGEADLLGTLTRTPDREEFLDYTAPYLEVPVVLFVNKRTPQYQSMKDLAGRRVGVVRDYGAHAWIETTHPEVIVVLMPNSREGLMRLALGHVDAMLEVLPVGQEVITENSLTSLKVLPEVQLSMPQHLAVAKGNGQLLTILQKGLDTITEAERREVFRKWTGGEALGPTWRITTLLWRSAIVLAAVALAFAAWNISLRRRVAQQERKIREDIERKAALEHRYRDLVQNASDIVYTHDLEGNFTSINPAAERLLGYSSDEISRLNVSDVVAEEHLDKVKQRIADKIERDVPTTYEVEVMARDGRRLWLEVSTRLLRENDRPVGVQGIGRDITDRKLAEQALHRSELLYHSLVENMPQAVFRKDLEGRFTFVNARFCQELGVNREEVIGKADYDLYPHELAEKYRANDRLVTESGQIHEWEEVNRGPQGQERWVQVVKTALKDEYGKVTGVQGIFWDITDKRSAQESLKRSLSLLQATLDSTADGVLVVDRQGRVASYNSRFLEMWRIPKELAERRDDTALLGYVLHELKDPETFMTKVRALYHDVDARSEDVLEFRDGRVFERFSQPQRLGDQIIGRVWCFRDVTARRRAEDEQRRLEEQFRQSQKLEAVGQLAAGVAHDFNNILTAIFGNASLLESELPPGSKAGEFLRQINLNAERAATLTRQLMLFSRKQSAKLEPINLNGLLENLVKMLRRLIGEDIHLQCDYAANLPLVNADPGMIEQVILNLVVNARDAMPRGGALALSTSAVSLDEEAARQRAHARNGLFVCLSVRDSGTGMDAATLARIFEPFFTTKDVGKGTGLGLATVHGIVEQHEGWIEVVSAPGKGSTFTVFLPGHNSSSVEPKKIEESAAPRGKGEIIMLVEDDPAVRTIVAMTLERLGYDLVTAASGRQAIELWPANRSRVSLLLTDIVMPEGTSGIELAARLQHEKPSLKIVYMSGYSAETSERRLPLRPGTRFVEKPCSPEHLAEVVRACLDGQV